LTEDFHLSTDAEWQRVGLRFKIRKSQAHDAPLAILIHGRAGGVDEKLIFRRCFPADISLASFQAPLVDSLRGFSWWDVESSKIERDAREAAQLAWSAIFELIELYELDPQQLWFSGFSQGAALTSVLLQLYPDFITRAALLAGFVLKIASPNDEAIRTGPLPQILIVHGEADDTIPIEVAAQGEKYLRGLGFPTQFFSEEKIGHKVGRKGIRLLKTFFGAEGGGPALLGGE
jgi:phospholipase/carboxylesterase